MRAGTLSPGCDRRAVRAALYRTTCVRRDANSVLERSITRVVLSAKLLQRLTALSCKILKPRLAGSVLPTKISRRGTLPRRNSFPIYELLSEDAYRVRASVCDSVPNPVHPL